MSLDPRTPVLVGGGQLSRRSDPLEPVDLIVEAVRLAADDAGAPALAKAVDSVRVVGMLSWRYRDPGALVGERLGASVRHTVYTGAGGSHPQALVNDACEDVLAGRCDVVVVGGAEAWRTRMALRKEGLKPDWTRQGDDVPEPELRPAVPMQHPTELAAGADRPVLVYPLFEQALRLASGRSEAEHRQHVAALWSRFSDVAATNPHAWTQDPVSAEDIATPSPRNRVISWPYTKLMVSNNNVEQGAAVIVCSVETAERLGVPRDRWVFPLAGAEASDTAAIGERRTLDGSPAIRHAGAAALRRAGVDVADLGPVDLYSCFPSAVQVAAHELGLPLDDPARDLTVTGGLTFAGGPWNNYSTHAIAAMVGAVRDSGRPGLVTANSGYLTKHSIGVYGPDPAPRGFRRESAQAVVDAEPTTRLVDDFTGAGRLEAWTVRHDREGRPDLAIAAVQVGEGARVLAQSDDPSTIASLMADDGHREVVVSTPASFALDS